MRLSREEHHALIMQTICQVIGREDKPLVLKGETALMLCYGLDRFSEELDFDLTKPLKTHLNIQKICDTAVKLEVRQGRKVALARFDELKKTETTHRCRAIFILPGDEAPLHLKLEISQRDTPNPESITVIDDIRVYTVDHIARLKLLAATESPDKPYRTAARDLHDLIFMLTQKSDELEPETSKAVQYFLEDIEVLMERYHDAYGADPLLSGRFYQDLASLEAWLEESTSSSRLSPFQGPGF